MFWAVVMMATARATVYLVTATSVNNMPLDIKKIEKKYKGITRAN